jgi:predicted 2-oxoglutarate/Fe(II)-dependent dioxygenase YbiX
MMKGVFISKIQPSRIFYEKTVIIKETPKLNTFYYSNNKNERKEKKEFLIYESKDRNIYNSKSLNINDVSWEKCSVGNSKTGDNYVDENIRNGYYSKDNVHLYINNEDMNGLLDNVFNNKIFTSINYNIAFLNGNYQPWKMLRYDPEGFFQRHTDGIRNENHFATGIIIPPLSLNKYEGGELVLYDKNEELVINADENDWKIVVFSLEIEHELKPVKSGQRIAFVCSFEYDREMKYILNSSVYNKTVDLKLDNKIIDEQKESIIEKIKKLENEILEYRKILELYDVKNDNQNSNNYILQELVDDILKQLKRNNNNGFIVALKDYYTKPIPSEFGMKDLIVYNTIINYFKEQNIEIRVMNFACKINKGDGSSPNNGKDEIYIFVNKL